MLVQIQQRSNAATYIRTRRGHIEAKHPTALSVLYLCTSLSSDRPAGRSSAFGAEGRSRNWKFRLFRARLSPYVRTYPQYYVGSGVGRGDTYSAVRRKCTASRSASASAFCERPTENRHFEKGRSRTKKKLRPAALCTVQYPLITSQLRLQNQLDLRCCSLHTYVARTVCCTKTCFSDKRTTMIKADNFLYHCFDFLHKLTHPASVFHCRINQSSA